jgi:hypothetical protein
MSNVVHTRRCALTALAKLAALEEESLADAKVSILSCRLTVLPQTLVPYTLAYLCCLLD